MNFSLRDQSVCLDFIYEGQEGKSGFVKCWGTCFSHDMVCSIYYCQIDALEVKILLSIYMCVYLVMLCVLDSNA